MKPPSLRLLILLVLVLFARSSFAANSPPQSRTLRDLDLIPSRVLKRSVSTKFFKSLLVSPVKGWIVVRGHLRGTRLSGARVVRSDLQGEFDALALQHAEDVRLAGYYSIDRPYTGPTVLMHLLIYQIADGTMALSFPHLEEPGGDQQHYFGCARLEVLKADGKWTAIKGPPGLEGKGWAVRDPGLGNNITTLLKLERLGTVTSFNSGR
jgi:hypothetical protein